MPGKPIMYKWRVVGLDIPSRKTGKMKYCELLKVTCGRVDCKKWFIVQKSWKDGPYSTRNCPHCFRVGMLPGR